MTPLFAFFGLGVPEIAVLGIIAVVLFGRKLPDMAKHLGKSIVEFKKGMNGLETGIDDVGPNTHIQAAPAPTEAIRPPQRVAATAPKFQDAPPQV